jgi:hypothetical protein
MWKTLPAILLCAAVVPGVLSAQQQASVLTTQDYVDIQQLYATLTEHLDIGTDAGARYANGYTADGVLEAEDGKVYKGRAAIIEFAKANGKGPMNVHHLTYDAIIDAAPGGAVGRSRVTLVSMVPPGKPKGLGGGQYLDDLVKTPDGWRIKKRTYIPGEPGAGRAGTPRAAGPR